MDTTDIAMTSEVTTLGWVVLVVVLGVILFAVIRKIKSDRRFKLTKLKVRSKIKVLPIDNTIDDQASMSISNQEYESSFAKYSDAFNQHIDVRNQTNALLKKLENTTIHNFKLIEKSKSLCKQPYDKYELEQKLNLYSFVPEELYPLKRISKFYIKPIVAVMFGALIGAILVMALLGLVSMFGNASTGASIQSLSGAAETNATLAWFGGGSLVSGGDGINGGIVALGVVFFIPVAALLYSSVNGREKNIQKFKSETKKLNYDDVQLRNSNRCIESEIAHIKNLYRYIEESYEDTCKLMYPKGYITRMRRGLSSMINKDHYSKEEAKAIDRLAQAVYYVDQTSDKMR